MGDPGGGWWGGQGRKGGYQTWLTPGPPLGALPLTMGHGTWPFADLPLAGSGGDWGRIII